MFTGIVETLGQLRQTRQEKDNLHFEIESPISPELKVDQSLSHDGVCLTVTQVEENSHWVTAISETLQKTNLGTWKQGQKINLERCMPAHGRFDGHIVQGHVDGLGICEEILDEKGSWKIRISYAPEIREFTVEKGSICVNGVSLTVMDSLAHQFSVAIIPYTWEHTNFHLLRPGQSVNLEFDILGKYFRKWMEMKKK
jgi:riboflavin synthase